MEVDGPISFDHRYNWGRPVRECHWLDDSLVLEAVEFILHLGMKEVGDQSGFKELGLLRGVHMESCGRARDLAKLAIEDS